MAKRIVLSTKRVLVVGGESRSRLFFYKNRRICNYLRIKRLFGLLGNWVTRWQPFLFQSSLLFCTNEITLDIQRYNFFMNEQNDGVFFIIAG